MIRESDQWLDISLSTAEMVGGIQPDFQIHTFDIAELQTIYEVVEAKYLEEMIHDMAKDVIGNGSNTAD